MSVASAAVGGFGVLVGGFLLYRAVEMVVGTVRTVATMRRAAAPPPAPPPGQPDADPPTFLLLLPMLREDRRVAAACRNLLPVVAQGRRVSVVVVTGAREAADRDAAERAVLDLAHDPATDGWRNLAVRAVAPETLPDLRSAALAGDRSALRRLLADHRRPTTGEATDPLIAELNREAGWSGFHHICLDDDGGTKVAKLNRALDLRFGPDVADRPDYVGVYDADSLPDLSIFAHVDAEVADRRRRGVALPDIFQQVSCYCANLRSLRGPGSSLSLADAIAQTAWALGFEYPLYRRYAAAVVSRRDRPLVYCIGHGCFVTPAFLDRIGGFPTESVTDDLALGFMSTVLGAEVAPIPALDYCDVAPSPVESIRQSGFWFSGSARFHQVLRRTRDRFGVTVSRRQWLKLHGAGALRVTAWAGQGPAWIVAVGLAAATGQWLLAGALVVAHVAHVQVVYGVTVWALHRLPGARRATGIDAVPRWRWAAGCVAASGNFVLRSLGPLAATVTLGRDALPTWKQER